VEEGRGKVYANGSYLRRPTGKITRDQRENLWKGEYTPLFNDMPGRMILQPTISFSYLLYFLTICEICG
jgi:hypothetical protein